MAKIKRNLDLIIILFKRDLIVRYRNFVFGMAWALLRPLLMSLILFVVFGQALGLASNKLEYLLLILCAWLPWQFFSQNITEIANCLILCQSLFSRTNFPLILVPLATSILNFLDLIVALIVCLSISFFIYGFQVKITYLILAIFLSYLLALGFGLIICALNTGFRDLSCLLPLFLNALFLLSPIGFSTNDLKTKWASYLAYSPLAFVMEVYRYAILPNHLLDFSKLIPSLISILIIFSLGLIIFFKMQEYNKEKVLCA